MNKLLLECFLKGVKDDSYGEGSERKERLLALIYAPGHDDFEVPISRDTFGKLAALPPMVTMLRVQVTLQTRQDIKKARSGTDYVRESVSVRFGDLELAGSLLDKKAS